MSGRVIVVGSVNVDLVASVERLPAPGETVTGATFARHPGGKGGNQATAAARLGAAVSFVGAVGDDSLADEARAALVSEGVDVAHLAMIPGPTGVALILVDRVGENLIAVASGANGAVTPELTVSAIDRLAPGPADVVLVGHEIPTVTARAALAAGRARGALTILNPAPADGIDRATLERTTIAVPNRIELGQLAVALGLAAGSVLEEAKGVLDALDEDRVAAVVVTLGAVGAILLRRDAEVVEVASPRVDAVDTVGAGDTFVGALAAGLANGIELEAAVRRAVVAASLSTTRPGARGGMPTTAELEAFLKGVPERTGGRGTFGSDQRREG
jgi:ribokinase